MEIRRIHLDEGTANYIQMLSYNESGLKILHATALKFDVCKDKVDEIYNKFMENHRELELAKAEMISTYAPELSGDDLAVWHVDFIKGVLVIEYQQT